MSERVSPGAAGKQLGVSGGGIRRAGYAKVTAARLGAWEHEPPAWLGKAILVRALNVAGYSGGYVRWIAAAGERASVRRAAALARAALLNAAGEPGS